MKKISLILALGSIAAVLTACGGSYSRTQTLEQQNAPFNCAGLHVKNAQWHFVDDFGQRVDVMGSCHAGMKHGTFDFVVNGKLVAKSKFIKDSERKTTCLVMGKTRTNLINCMQLNAAQGQNNLQMQQAPMQQPMQQAPMMQDDQDDQDF